MSAYPRKQGRTTYVASRRSHSVPPLQLRVRLSNRSDKSDLPDVTELPVFEANRQTTPMTTDSEPDLISSPPGAAFDSLILQEIADQAIYDGFASGPVSDDDALADDHTPATDDALAIADALASDDEELDVEMGSYDLPIRNGVYWDMELDCEARPMSKECTETVYPGDLSKKTKCVCGNLVGGLRVPRRNAKKHEYNGPKFVFNMRRGAYISDKTSLNTPFKSLKVTLPNGKPKILYVPANYTMANYLAGDEIPKLSSERTVPKCAHFPVTGLTNYNVPFVKGRIAKRNPNPQCVTSRLQDQARLLCLIEDEVREDGTIRRRMNVHAPPADWNDPNTISCLNRWRAQFRSRKLHITSRAPRTRWSTEAINWMVERLARDPDVYRARLARQVSKKFNVERTEHAVSCAIDNHNLRARAETLRNKWETEGMDNSFENDADIDMEDDDKDRNGDETMSELSDFDDIENTPVRPKLIPKLSKAQLAAKKREAFLRETKMMDWLL